ncbi:LAMI_0A05028g1_1 [Lachancea mirantina]|uniref:LAMI_0A05028g1_1 n=1 Tax=Lachancea mirantina TaxID=1230905 RepID=A0A1G4IPF3_9SACH|nr:LAMI_0A05028g1_1 [Lachancea mirantina]
MVVGHGMITSRKVALLVVVICCRFSATTCIALLLCVVFTFLVSHMLNANLPSRPPPEPIRLGENNPIGVETTPLDSINLFDEHPELQSEIDQLLNNISSSFIQSWFKSIDNNPESPFLIEVRNQLLNVVQQVYQATEKVDVSELVVRKAIPLITSHLRMFCSYDNGPNSDFEVAVEFDRNYKLHSCVSRGYDNMNKSIEDHIREKTVLLLPKLIDKRELSSNFVRIILREVLVTNLFMPLINKFIDPDFWNLNVNSMATDVLRERFQVKKFRAALSKEWQDPRDRFLQDFERESEEATAKILVFEFAQTTNEFSDYLRKISSLTLIPSLKAVRISIMVRLLSLDDTTASFKEKKLMRHRLQMSLNLVESRIGHLAGKGMDHGLLDADREMASLKVFLTSISLESVLTHELYLKFFKGFLENHDKQGQIYLNLWQRIEAIKNPLEDPLNGVLTMNHLDDAHAELEDIFDAYFKDLNLEQLLHLSTELVHRFISCIVEAKSSGDNKDFLQARKHLLVIQNLLVTHLKTKSFVVFRDSAQFIDMTLSQVFQDGQMIQEILSTEKKGFPAVSKSDNGVNLEKLLDDIFEGDSDDTSLGNNVVSTVEQLVAEKGGKLPLNSEQEESIPREGGLLEQENYPFDEIVDERELKDKIAQHTININKLRSQLSLIDHLTLKADLTNNSSQKRLLEKSARSVTRELNNSELLIQQYTIRISSNSLFRKCDTIIKSYLSDISPETGKEIIYYVITVTQQTGENQVTSWDIPRRYSEFYKLNAYVKRTHARLVKHLQNKDCFPEKIKISLVYNVSKSLLYEERIVKLDSFLKALLNIPEICRDEVFRRFLTEPLIPFGGVERKRETRKRQSLIARVETTPAKINDGPNAAEPKAQNLEIAAEIEDEVIPDHEGGFSARDSSATKVSFIKPLCDLFVVLFSLNDLNGRSLRGRAVILVLQQILGGTAEKYVKDSLLRVFSASKISQILRSVNSSLWVDGVFCKNLKNSEATPRGWSDKTKTRSEARSNLEKLFVETSGKILSKSSCQKAADKVHALIQNQYLNASLVLEVFDLLVDEIFLKE